MKLNLDRMLYDFHHTQNAKKPGAIHATYLITGILASDQQPPSQPTHSHLLSQDEDTPMESSPLPSSLPDAESGPSFDSEDAEPAEEAVHNTTVLLVREEELEAAKADFGEIHTIFVYSLEPGPLKDFQLLAQCNREVMKESWNEDPLEAYPNYGLITNKDVRRRTARRPTPSVAISTQPAKAAATASAKATQPAAAVKKEDKKTPDPTGRSAPPAKSAAHLKREASDLFKSFAKSKPPKLKTTDSNAITASASAKPSPVDKSQDMEMQGMSEDEDDEPPEEIDEEAAAREAERVAEARRARKEKEDRLRQMMEDDDDDGDEEMTDAVATEQESEAALDKPKEPEKKEEVTVSGGRRRGRRKIMKKRTYQDEDGYLGIPLPQVELEWASKLIQRLVTKEEAAWESFSEDEPEAKKPKMAPVQVKKKAGPASKGQGTLANFFKKK